jgi:hypothetical protein
MGAAGNGAPRERDLQLKAMRFPTAISARPAPAGGSHVPRQQARVPAGAGADRHRQTVGSLFPMLKASAEHGVDKIFFLAAKTSGRQMALDAVDLIREGAPLLPLRTLELAAKSTACVNPDKACHGDSCPLAKGFYDRLPAARESALAIMAPSAAAAHRRRWTATRCGHRPRPQRLPLLPGSEMARWCDIVIGDYNYYFDISAMLHSLTQLNDWKVNVLVDEAHNMVSRARKMYSADMEHDSLRLLRKIVPEELKKPLERVHKQWNQLEKEQTADYQSYAELPEKFMGACRPRPPPSPTTWPTIPATWSRTCKASTSTR